MDPILVPPSDPREAEALRKIGEMEEAVRSEVRWSWATFVPRVARTLGLVMIIWAVVGLGIAFGWGKVTLPAIVQAGCWMAAGAAVVVSATWGYRYAHQRAFGRNSRPGL
jgi:hypothetical protein